MNNYPEPWTLVSGIMFVLGMLSFAIKGEGSVIIRAVKFIMFYLGVVGLFSICLLVWFVIFK
jgi:hypothetical protein